MINIGTMLEKTEDSFYRPDPFQTYIAARIMSEIKKPVVMNLAAGAGKSFIIVMLALTFLLKKKKVTIVVPNSLLKKQMKTYTQVYIPEEGLRVLKIDEVKHEKEEPDVFICDEFDYMLENQPVIFQKDSENKLTLYGLAPVFHCKEVIFLSATCDQYVKKLLNQVFNVKAENILKFPSI